MRLFTFSRPTRRPPRAARGLRPRLEVLEERTLLRTTVLNFVDSGWYDQTGFHGPTNENYLTGRANGTEFRSFYVFNIPDMGASPILRAQLRAFNPGPPFPGYQSPDPTETFTLHHVNTPVAALRAGGSGLVARFQDLGDGTVYGSQTVSAADNGQVVTVNLNDDAVADLNAASGQAFAIGGRNATLGAAATEAFFAFSGNPEEVRQLIIEDEPAGPVLLDYQPRTVSETVSSIRVLFDRSIDPATFTVDDVTDFTGQLGLIQATSVVPVPGSLNTRFDINFPLQVVTGLYGMAIGPNIADPDGNLMDQDDDGAVGTFDDRFLAIFAIEGARVTAATAGALTVGQDRIRLTFNKAMDPSTFADWVVVDTPSGRIGATGAMAVPGSGNRQIDVFFPPQNQVGTYVYTVGAGVRDVFGNPLDQNRNLVGGEIPGDNFSGMFRLALPYFSRATTFENIDLELGQPGVFNILSNTDDGFAAVSLLGNTFNFYGVHHGTLFVSSNGLVTFGNGNAAFTNTNLTDFPGEQAIAPLWDDWIKEPSGTQGMILGRFDSDRLIIEWNDVRHFPTSPSGVTFQVILQLNTDTTPGNIIVNYVDLIAGDPALDNGASATVGIKDVGLQGPNRTLVSFNMLNPLVGNGRAILFTADPGAGPSGGSGSGAILAALQIDQREPAAVAESSRKAAPVDHLFMGAEMFGPGLARAEEEVVSGGTLRDVAEGASLFDLVL